LATVGAVERAVGLYGERCPFALFIVERCAVVFEQLAGARVIAVGGEVDGEDALVVESEQRFGQRQQRVVADEDRRASGAGAAGAGSGRGFRAVVLLVVNSFMVGLTSFLENSLG
jgi:hypothetical protein